MRAFFWRTVRRVWSLIHHDTTTALDIAAGPRRRRRRNDPSEAESTRWHFRAQILDRLDEYFYCFKQLRKHADRDHYRLFSRLGLALPADVFINPDHEDYKLAPEKRPTAGGIAWPVYKWNVETSDLDEWLKPSFVLFEKIKRPIGVQLAPKGHDVYNVFIVFDDRARVAHERRSTVVGYFAAVSPRGAVQILRELQTDGTTFSVGHGRKRVTLSIPRRRFVIPPAVTKFAADNGNRTVDDLARYWLVMALRTYNESLAKILIRVKRGTSTAMFGVDVARCKYFFKDRGDEAIAADGKRKRIFHAVREHERVLSAKRSTTVKAHYRGLRHFTWNGSTITITLPSNRYMVDLPVPAEEFETAPHSRDWLAPDQLGAVMAERLDA